MHKRSFLIALLSGALLAVLAPAAHAYSVSGWTAGLYSNDYSGPSDTGYYTQAGGHPFEGVTDFTLDTSGSVTKSVRVDLPPGLISNPQGIPQCTNAQFPSCPSDTQVGVVKLTASVAGITTYLGASVYNIVPSAGQVSDFAFNTVAGRTDIIGGIRSATDDGLFFTIAAPQTATLDSSTLIFWGVPGDAAHDPQRGWSCLSTVVDLCTPPASGTTHTLTAQPFITLPSGCVAAGQVTTLTVDSSVGEQAQATSPTPVPATGCAGVPFSPSLTVTPTTTEDDAPTGLLVDLHVPQSTDAATLASSQLEGAAVTLPPGMTLDPSAATGLAACTHAQFGKGSDAAPACPAASQVGTVEIDTPLLAGPLTGSVFLGCNGASTHTPCPASDGLADLYVYATAAAQGVTQKLVGRVTANPLTGQLTTSFVNQPEVPFSDFKLRFDGGSTAPIATPLACGHATTTSSLTPWSANAAATPTSTFTVDSNGSGGSCAAPIPFTPTLAVTAKTNRAGAFDSPLTFALSRADRQQYLDKISAELPLGLLGLISRVAQCPNAQAAAGTCPATSRIGTVSVLAGAGREPITQSGRVFLTGPYAGAPFGLSIVIHAIAGPFDLGMVVVRAAIEVNPTTAQLTIASDPLPQVVRGVPLRIRRVAVTIDRNGFTINPTGCEPAAAVATLSSAQGTTATALSPFDVTDCGALRFAPAIQISLTGKGQTAPGKHPALTATVTSTPKHANVRSASVTLPLSLALDPRNSEHLCPVAASAVDACPARTQIGTATVDTPVLNQPLIGPVYLVQGIRTTPQGEQVRTLPALLVTLRGQVALDLRAQTSVDSHSRLVTTFPTVPDAPLSRFELQITGGRRGVLVVTGHAGLCHGVQRARAAFQSHSGAGENLTVRMSTDCRPVARLTSLRVRGHTVRLSVAVPAAGRLRVSARGLVGASRHLRHATTANFVLHLSSAAAARIHHRHASVRVRLGIRYSRRGRRTQTIVTRRVSIR